MCTDQQGHDDIYGLLRLARDPHTGVQQVCKAPNKKARGPSSLLNKRSPSELCPQPSGHLWPRCGVAQASWWHHSPNRLQGRPQCQYQNCWSSPVLAQHEGGWCPRGVAQRQVGSEVTGPAYPPPSSPAPCVKPRPPRPQGRATGIANVRCAL